MNIIDKNIFLLTMIIFVIAILVIFFILGLDHSLHITTYLFHSDKVNEKIRIVFLSDLHSCQYGKEQKDLINAVKRAKPDVILFVGDIIDDKLPDKLAFQLIEGVVDLAPSYYVSGNHEGYTGELESLKENVSKRGLKVLAGEKDTLEVRGSFINIIGIDDPYLGERIYQKQLVGLQAMKNPEFTIFLSHRPERTQDYNSVESDLILAGHAHGGQWRIPRILPGLLAPHQGFFPKYTAGFYPLEKSTLLVSRGLSYKSPRIPRFFNPPELLVIDIEPELEN